MGGDRLDVGSDPGSGRRVEAGDREYDWWFFGHGLPFLHVPGLPRVWHRISYRQGLGTDFMGLPWGKNSLTAGEGQGRKYMI
jgi:hypothetical protein